MKVAFSSTVVACAAAVVVPSTAVLAFTPVNVHSSNSNNINGKNTQSSFGASASVAESRTDVAVEKPTGTSFLPEETVERAKAGSPIEKAKMAKDPTNAWVDVYEYARKIREGEMTWEEVEKADLDTVR